MAHYMGDVLEEKDKLKEHLLVNGGVCLRSWFLFFISFMLGLVMIDLIWKVNFLKISN